MNKKEKLEMLKKIEYNYYKKLAEIIPTRLKKKRK